MAFALVQTKDTQVITTAGTLTMTSGWTTGNLAVVTIDIAPNRTLTGVISDSAGNTWSLAVGPIAGGGGNVYQYYSILTATDSTKKIFGTASGAVDGFHIGAVEVSGNAASSVLVQAGSATGNSAAMGKALTTTAGNMIISNAEMDANRNWTAGATYTLFSTNAAVAGNEYKLSATTAENGTMTNDGAAGWGFAIAEYAAATGGGGVVNQSFKALSGAGNT